MGYRNETEHLRHRVQQLEGELAQLKGGARAGKEERFAAKAKRQTLLLAVFALLASLAGVTCLVPTVAVTVEGDGSTELDRVATGGSYERLTFRGTVDADAVHETGYYTPHRWGPLREDPRVIVLCRSYSCPYDVESELERAALSGSPTSERAFRGTVHRSGDYAFDELDSSLLLAHAEAHDLTLADLRVVELQRHEDPRPGLWMMTTMILFAALLLWVAVAVHRAVARKEPPLPGAGDWITRDPLITLILSIATCRLYELVWIAMSTGQLRRITGRRDLIPGLDVVLIFATFGLWMFWVFYRNAEAVDEALADRGHYSNHRGTVVGLTLGSFVCGVLHWGLIYKLQEAYNVLITERPED